jgi:hypothetical protein
MAAKQRKSRRKVRTQTIVVVSEETAQVLRIAAMLERLAAEIRRLILPRA